MPTVSMSAPMVPGWADERSQGLWRSRISGDAITPSSEVGRHFPSDSGTRMAWLKGFVSSVS